MAPNTSGGGVFASAASLNANDEFSTFIYVIVSLTIVVLSCLIVKNFRWVLNGSKYD